jgi:ATP-dependent DNA helicase RecG
MELKQLEGIGPVRAESLRAMGIFSLRDLLFMLPVRYDDYTKIFPCNTRQEGNILVSGTVTSPPKLSVFHGLKKVTATISDNSGKMPVCWYNEPWMVNNIHEGDYLRLFGRLSIKNNRRTLQNPRIVSDDEHLCPIYRSIKGFPSKSFRKLIRSALKMTDECCVETLPADFRVRYQLCELNYALYQAHFPDDLNALKIARRRLSFEQILLYLIYVNISKSGKHFAFPFSFHAELLDEYWKSLPFSPTNAQKKVLRDIAADLKKDTAMSRLIQGDVGSGKTAVAFGAIFLTAQAGFQSAMMAPTEILVRQHYENARKILEPLGVRCRMLTGSTKAKERKEILRELANNTCQAVFGTHALISKDVNYSCLGLAITDEQHRFGVNQRSLLQQKGKEDQREPHVLVMSATPIPRSLALILYGDLNISIIDELPAGRIPVKTRIVPESKRQDMYIYVREQVTAGKQAYIVCPLVEESDSDNDLQSAKSLYEKLKNNELKGVHIGLTWGAQKPEEKEKTLGDFSAGKYDVLVSTTVIEVGVNNPNATIMIIENAERYGLSQLHQLRGRVGRGNLESWCFLLSDASDKLKVLCSTNDGFIISQKDLELRGPGDLIGTRQSGEPGAAFLYGDIRLLDEVTRCIQDLHRDPGLKKALEIIEKSASDYFSESGHSVALN